MFKNRLEVGLFTAEYKERNKKRINLQNINNKNIISSG